MDLILWRHAEAEDAAALLPDNSRRLTVRGGKQARMVARWLGKYVPENLRILVSPALRARMTAQALGLPFIVEPRIGIGADLSELLAATDWPNHDGTILVVGHQPTLGRVAAFLSAGKEADWKVKKGGLWWFSTRKRRDELQTILRAVVYPNFTKGRKGCSEILSQDQVLLATTTSATDKYASA